MEEKTTELEAQSLLSVKGEEGAELLDKKVDTVPLIKMTELPSGFKGYPDGTIISYRPITLGELEALNSGELDVPRAIALLLKSIHCNTLNAADLYYWDVMFIGIKRKLLAFGDSKGTLYEYCPMCGNIVSKQFEYADLAFKEIQAPNLPLIMKVCQKELHFGLLTLKDFLEIDVEQGELGVYARMIKNLEFEEAFSLVSNAYGADIKKLKFVDKQLNYGLQPLTTTCTNAIVIENPNFNITKPSDANNPAKIRKTCNTIVNMEVTSPFEVVFPEDEFDGHNEFEVRYG